jgi:medium-chain acyl-[acyl-carrier-protein] hydrolase
MSPWIIRRPRASSPAARLFCFHHAGVGASVYRLWSSELPASLEVCAVQLPGREGRVHERAITTIPAIIDALLPALRPALEVPFAFFGHSMGAVIATEVTRSLLAAGGPLPAHLFVSARRPPPVPDPLPPLHRLSDHALVAEIDRRYGGIPAEVLQHPEVLALLLPTLRADLTALETHLPPPRLPMPVPVTVLGGADDPTAPREQLEAWRGETSAGLRVRVYPGGHFYLAARRGDVLADIAATLATLLQPAHSDSTQG